MGMTAKLQVTDKVLLDFASEVATPVQ